VGPTAHSLIFSSFLFLTFTFHEKSRPDVDTQGFIRFLLCFTLNAILFWFEFDPSTLVDPPAPMFGGGLDCGSYGSSCKGGKILDECELKLWGLDLTALLSGENIPGNNCLMSLDCLFIHSLFSI
jgi:hypothetical protein